MDILNELYSGSYEPHSNFPHTSEYREAINISASYQEKISKAFSNEFAEDLWNAQAKVATLECQHYYRMGFRLGFQMALEGMSTD